MKNLEEAYNLYKQADGVLAAIKEEKNQRRRRSSFKKNYETDLLIQLLVVDGLITTEGEGKDEILLLTEKGSLQVSANGYDYKLLPDKVKVIPKTFRQHLDDITGLLTVFGILNAVILFATQVKVPGAILPESLNGTGVQFISVSMYIISIMVLWEIIWVTLNNTPLSFKFQALYYLLCMTTLGMGMLFVQEYYPLLYMAGGMIVFFGTGSGIFWILLCGLRFVVTRRSASWFVKYQKGIFLLLFLISVLSVLGIVKLVFRVFFLK